LRGDMRIGGEKGGGVFWRGYIKLLSIQLKEKKHILR